MSQGRAAGRCRNTAACAKHRVKDGRLLVLQEKMKRVLDPGTSSTGMAAKGRKRDCETRKYKKHHKHLTCDKTNQVTRNF